MSIRAIRGVVLVGCRYGAPRHSWAFVLRRSFALLFVLLAIATWSAAQDVSKLADAQTTASAPAAQPIRDEATLRAIRQVQERVEALRDIRMGHPLDSYYLDSVTLRELVRKAYDDQYPAKRREAAEAFLKSLRAIPEDFDILAMLISLLDEQLGGMYDEDSKRLYVRLGFDIAQSELARLILAHEICHALQDYRYSLKKIGYEAPEDDDRSLAVMTVAEGDATYLMNEYAALYASPDMMKELPQALFMDQSALKETPYFFQQQFFFPYIQGELLVREALRRGPECREKLFSDPPRTTEQTIHFDKYFGERDEPSSLALLAKAVSGAPELPNPPAGFERRELNTLGELGTRILFEEALGAGIAYDAATGWDGDAYAIHGDGKGGWWFVWETAWDTPEDAMQFWGAWVTLWRSFSGDRKLGSLKTDRQTLHCAPWTVKMSRVYRRVVVTWTNREG